MAAPFTQENRRLRIGTPLGPDALLITALTGTEGVSTLFHFQAELLGRDEHADFDAIVGQNVTVAIAAGGGDRFVNGIVSRFSQGGTVGRHASYTAEIVPWLWFLTRTTDCRIFQKKSVPDIARQIFGEYGFSDYRFQLTGSYEPREYCVQYRETDHAFVARLLEEEGVFFFFAHEDGRHTMILGDTPRAHEPCPLLDQVRFQHEQVSTADDDVVTTWEKLQELRPGKYAHTDYNFETPSIDLAASATGQDSRHYELYDYPAGATNRERTERLARLRQQQEDTSRILFRGTGYVRSLTPGHLMSLRAAGEGVSSAFDGSYVLTSVSHTATESYPADEQPGEVSYQNKFECIPLSVPFRPARRTAKPALHGVQTAVVVGPAGDEIFVDRYGRVKVQFFWDREGKRDENSSCWLRVSQPWAGQGWGGVSIPRIGQEVVVSFLEGDPDQPIIVGRVYNGEQMPPYGLPGGGVVSGLKSKTHKGGGYNELSMDDTAGKEKVTIHGQYDMNTTVEHDQTTTVHNNRTDTIDVNDTESVGVNQTLTVGSNRSATIGANDSLNVAANHTSTIGGSDALNVAGTRTVSVATVESHSVGAAQTVQIGAAQNIAVGGLQAVEVGASQSVNVGVNQSTTVGSNLSTKAGAKQSHKAGATYVVEAGAGITLKSGGATITLKGGNITIKGAKVTVKGSGGVTLKGAKITEN